MNQDILLSKIVPNPTDSTWAQAYTTLNVYITLSIEKGDSKNPVTPYGKELLEKLQREFFALDDKSLENIKKAVGNVSKNIEEGYLYSILVGAIVNDVLYIIIASEGQVIIKRKGNIGVIATGIENELHGFSGKLEHDDIIVFETGDFAKKIPTDSIAEYISSPDVSQIAENITPLVHENSKGTEGAIILQYKDLTGIGHTQDENEFMVEKHEPEKEIEEKKDIDTRIPAEENPWTKPHHENRNIEEISGENSDYNERDYMDNTEESGRPSFPFIALPSVGVFTNKKTLIVGAIILLVLILAGSIFFQVYKADQEKKAAELEKVIQPIQSKFDEGTNLVTLNKTLALEDFNQASKMADEALAKFPKNSAEYKKLSELKQQIESKVSDSGGGSSAKNVKELVSSGGKIKNITSITAKGGTLLILDKDGEQVATVATDGTIKKTYDIKESDTFISSDDKFIYTMGENVTSIDRGNGKVAQIAKKVSGSSFDIFGSNFYTLTDSDILKYKAPTYDSSSYFTDKPSFKGAPYDMSISGPVWVLEAGGSVESFTKGKNDGISLSGLAGPLADGGHIYADPDNDNIYVMDVKNQRVVVFNEKGEFQTQYEGSFIKDANSFAIDEKNKTGYVLSGGKIYSFDL